MLPDTGERYLSTPLFEDIPADMSDEEMELSRSTPGARFDAPPPAVAAPRPDAGAGVEIPVEVDEFVSQLLSDPEQPLVMFALEWCEFCWSLRKLFARCSIPYRSIDLDSTAYQRGDRGGQIRASLAARTGSRTIPQVFVGGEYIGGCTETLALFRDGDLQRMLRAHGVPFDESIDFDPQTLLPGWLQPR
jgi:cysteine synthase